MTVSIPGYTEVSEAKWEKMTRPERAVTLAHDVLEWIGSGRIYARRQTFISLVNGSMMAYDGNIRDVFFRKQKTCCVCAKGAAVVAKMKRKVYSETEDLDCDPVTNGTLDDVFSKNMMDIMEAMFEHPEQYHLTYKTADESLHLIYSKIIECQGSEAEWMEGAQCLRKETT